uniref:Uncharacterized protein n=1 Tax=Timema bartmani TaxID=61472 RepID=A0A7R9FBC3_9NEOP|nr:unnamed protein product [Timema bartmani]
MVLEGPEISIRPLGALISDEALRCIIDAAAGRPRFAKGPVNVEEEVRILRRQFENRWTPPPVDETIKKILLGRPFSLELYRSLALKTELLDAAINMGDGNAILGVVLFLMKTLKKSQVYQLLRTRPAAVNQYSHYLTTRLQVNELTDLLDYVVVAWSVHREDQEGLGGHLLPSNVKMLGRSQECSMKQFQLAVQATHNPQRRIHKLKACLNNHFLAPNKDRQLVENYVKLLGK